MFVCRSCNYTCNRENQRTCVECRYKGCRCKFLSYGVSTGEWLCKKCWKDRGGDKYFKPKAIKKKKVKYLHLRRSYHQCTSTKKKHVEPDNFANLPPIEYPPGYVPWRSLSANERQIFCSTILARDGHCCVYCGMHLRRSTVSLDHLIPVILGGLDMPSNLVSACKDCNDSKQNLLPLNFILARLGNTNATKNVVRSDNCQ